MVYFVIDKDNTVLYQGTDKERAIDVKKTDKRAVIILYQPAPDGDKYILRENV